MQGHTGGSDELLSVVIAQSCIRRPSLVTSTRYLWFLSTCHVHPSPDTYNVRAHHRTYGALLGHRNAQGSVIEVDAEVRICTCQRKAMSLQEDQSQWEQEWRLGVVFLSDLWSKLRTMTLQKLAVAVKLSTHMWNRGSSRRNTTRTRKGEPITK